MPGINWTQIVHPNYVFLLPELIVLGTMLLVMVSDFYVKEKRGLVWGVLAGLILAMGAVWYSATDPTIAQAIDNQQPLEFFGRMLIADGISFFLKMVLLVSVALVTLLSVEFVEKFLRGMFLEFYEILLAASLGVMLMVSSRDIITIYIGLELTSISSYVLAGLLRHDPKSNESGLKYFLNGAFASAILLFGVSLIFGLTGTTYLPEIGSKMLALAKSGTELAGITSLAVTGMLMMAAGIGFKIAAFPMHLWAPDVYEGAPTPVTGFFSVVPKAGAFGAILRIFAVGFGVAPFSVKWSLIWAVLATASMFVGNLTALLQSNIKRMMGYSSIAQAGYILVGVVAMGNLKSSAGIAAVLFYVLAYALTNLGIFAVLTHMDQEGGWVSISDFKGLSERNPLYAWAMLFFFISLIGIPPTAGFMGKFFLFKAAVGSGYVWLAVCMAINSAISVGYYYGVVKAMFLEKADKGALPVNRGAVATVVISFVGVLIVALAANPFLGLAQTAADLVLR